MENKKTFFDLDPVNENLKIGEFNKTDFLIVEEELIQSIEKWEKLKIKLEQNGEKLNAGVCENMITGITTAINKLRYLVKD